MFFEVLNLLVNTSFSLPELTLCLLKLIPNDETVRLVEPELVFLWSVRGLSELVFFEEWLNIKNISLIAFISSLMLLLLVLIEWSKVLELIFSESSVRNISNNEPSLLEEEEFCKEEEDELVESRDDTELGVSTFIVLFRLSSVTLMCSC